ncbi:MAG: hypothetical protein HUU57_09670 [Bdellovibrio sp.]|nr:hypothetical protein [Bdellovibrio sp.]
MNAQQAYILQQQQAQLAALQNQQSTGLSPQVQGMIQLASHYCPLLFGGGNKKTAMGKSGHEARRVASDVEKVTDKVRQDAGRIKEKDVNEELAQQIGADVAAKLSPECASFLGKDGKVGPNGSYLLQQIRDKKDVFVPSVRGEKLAKKVCPGYSVMNTEQKEFFWLWVMIAKSSGDVKCTNEAPASAKRAPGMFAINPIECPKMSDAKRPSQSLQCGIDLMAAEIRALDGKDVAKKFLNEEDRKLAAQYRHCAEAK